MFQWLQPCFKRFGDRLTLDFAKLTDKNLTRHRSYHPDSSQPYLLLLFGLPFLGCSPVASKEWVKRAIAFPHY
ncbi:hypothetical protein [Coleofasciculus sp. FACHB-1120]|uniref:hypothetical protein n=1 Tax=Coleofasciculus sp. FACHB-1120 TaxID=2692783 RepID=UPI001684E2CE|nr:hypothetical protein [Coleofasciculus sp. FACHB-1120]MBD2743117.1 hypothetical protein [Coleofasciculus sp. FACHB-1120]